MANKVSICNGALLHLGVEPITSLSDVIKPAQKCNQEYTKVRDKLLEMNDWTFAKKRVQLTSTGVTPIGNQYDTEFLLPSDRIHIIEYLPNFMQYEIEGDKLLTNESTVYCIYIYKNDNTSSYTPLFVELFELELASRLAYPLRQDKDLASMMVQKFNAAVDVAGLRDIKQQYDREQEDPAFDGDVRNTIG